MIRVRKHERQLASGKVTSVRQHQRNADVSAGQGGLRPRPEDEWWDNPDGQAVREGDPEGTWYFTEGDNLMAMHPDGTVRPADEPDPGDRDFATPDGSLMIVRDSSYFKTPDEPAATAPDPAVSTRQQMKQGMREWRARDVPLLPPEPMTPQMAKLMGCETPEGREKFERLRAYREAGYDGPLGPDGRIPDPDDPAEHESISALAYMRWQEESK